MNNLHVKNSGGAFVCKNILFLLQTRCVERTIMPLLISLYTNSHPFAPLLSLSAFSPPTLLFHSFTVFSKPNKLISSKSAELIAKLTASYANMRFLCGKPLNYLTMSTPCGCNQLSMHAEPVVGRTKVRIIKGINNE